MEFIVAIMLAVFIGFPVAVGVGFIVSIISFIKCPTESVAKKKRWRTFSIVSGALALIVVATPFALNQMASQGIIRLM